MSTYRITYTDPNVSRETVEAAGFDNDVNAEFFDFVGDDHAVVFTVATREVRSVRKLNEEPKSKIREITVDNTAGVDLDELKRHLDKAIRQRDALKYVGNQ